MQVALLTEEQKDLLVNQLFCIDSHFNPIQDINDNWVISLEEVDQCSKEEFNFVKTLPLIDYEPKPVVIP
jgi:hypothetical protein